MNRRHSMDIANSVHIEKPMLGGPVAFPADNNPPTESASDYSEGFKKHGSAGQLWIVKQGQWEKF